MTPMRHTWAIFLFGFASGVPYPWVNDALATWLRSEGWSVPALAWLGYAGLPYALKVLWAPLLDRLVPPLLGRRRGWIALTQAVCAVVLAGLAMHGPSPVGPVVVLVSLLALASASQDIAVNAWTIETTPITGRTAAAGWSVWGYRLALLVSGGVLLNLAAACGWRWALLGAAGLLLIGSIGLWLAEEPAPVPRTAIDAGWWSPFKELWAGMGPALPLLLAVVLCYRLPDGAAGAVSGAFMTDRFALADLGAVRAVAGLVAAALGAALAAWLAVRWSPRAVLILGVLAMALSNLSYAAVEIGTLAGRSGLGVVVLIDQGAGAAAGTALAGVLMGCCRAPFAASQYALLTALMALGPFLVRPMAVLQPTLGWSGYFLATMLAALPVLALLSLPGLSLVRRPDPR